MPNRGFRWGRFAAFAAVALALAVVPRIARLFQGTTADAASTTARSDLRNIAAAQEEIRERTGAYASVIDSSVYRLSAKVTGPDIALTSDGYTAVVGYAGTSLECALFVGSTPRPPARVPDSPACSGASGKPRDWPLPLLSYALAAIVLGAGVRLSRGGASGRFFARSGPDDLRPSGFPQRRRARRLSGRR